jgi:hypothetical protein
MNSRSINTQTIAQMSRSSDLTELWQPIHVR